MKTTSAHALALGLVCLVAACARAPSGAAPASTTSTPGAESAEAEEGASPEAIVRADADFGLALDAGASCDMLVPLRDRICDLADRVCRLASEVPDDETTRAQCEDGARRCLAATEGVRNRCGP